MGAMAALPVLDDAPSSPFPPASRAWREPNGLLCAGGDLSVERLLRAYRRGIFPWYMPGEPILWWCPNPRCVFDTATLRAAPRLRRWLRRSSWQVRADLAFAAVIDGCAAPRDGDGATWISAEMRAAYVELHRVGVAHSIEVRDGVDLVGGLYGVALGRMFFAESMFSARSNGSKVALLALARRLAQWGFPLIDAQVPNRHLTSLGAQLMPRPAFIDRVAELTARPEPLGPWTERFGGLAATEMG
jgi:leucyl/phenylalanyl-tRNA--protein transferase